MARSADPDPVTPMPAGMRRCPICGKRSIARHQPFCSARCANIDLGRWLKGSYRVESEEPPEDGTEANEP
jgi:endogenous inhibitor of DNA gyrase (YacG/DUF329 family)